MPNTAPADDVSLPDLIEQLSHAYNASTRGDWGKGASTHHTVSRWENQAPYRIAEFHHADDATFCDVAHRLMPAIIQALADRARSDEAAGYRRMFEAACVDLGLINEALGLDPNDGGADPILSAIAELRSQIADRARNAGDVPETQADAEQRAFEDWLSSTHPSGDHAAVQRQWEASSDLKDVLARFATPPQNATHTPAAQGGDALGPSVPDTVMAYIQAYGDSRADDDGLSALRIGETVLSLRRWAAALASPAPPQPEQDQAVPAGWSLEQAERGYSLRSPGGEQWLFQPSIGTGTPSHFIYEFLAAMVAAAAGDKQ